MLRHLRAIGLLPGVSAGLIPAAILVFGDFDIGWSLPDGLALLPVAAGAALICTGLVLMYRTISLFAREGDGTLAPWDPPRRLVVQGPYRHVRNPMITGVITILIGEAALFGSPWILVWAAAFLVGNQIWFPRVEEPGLMRRFGAEYEAYRHAVPRWVPRRRPWSP